MSISDEENLIEILSNPGPANGNGNDDFVLVDPDAALEDVAVDVYAWRVVFTALCALTVLHCVVGLALFVRRRHLHPLRGHATPLVAVIGVSLTWISVTICQVHMGVATPCWLRLTGVVSMATTAVVAYIVRAWRLYLFYTLQTRKMDAQVVASASSPGATRPGAHSMPPSFVATDSADSRGPLVPKRPKSASAASSSNGSRDETSSNGGCGDDASRTGTGGSGGGCGGAGDDKPRSRAGSRHSRHSGDEYSRSEAELSRAEYAAYVAMYRAANTGIYRYCTDRNFFILTAFVSLLAIAAQWIPFAMTESFAAFYYDAADASPCPSLTGQRMVLVALFALAVMLLLYTGYKFRGVFDGFLVKRELKYCGLIIIFTAVIVAMDEVFDYPLAVMLLLYTGYKFRGVFDGFLVKRELKYCGLIIIFTAVIVAMDEVFDYHQPIDLAKLVLANAAAFFTITWKVLATFGLVGGTRVKQQVTRQRSALASVSIHTTTSSSRFRDMLNDPVGMALFAEHLKREWSVENLLFYEAAQSFKQKCKKSPGGNHADLVRMAKEIYNNFIKPNAPNMVNLPSETKNPLAQRMKAEIFDRKSQDDTVPPHDLFDGAATNIYRLMKSDSYIRFQNTPLFEEYRAHRESMAITTDNSTKRSRFIELLGGSFSRRMTRGTSVALSTVAGDSIVLDRVSNAPSRDASTSIV